MEKSKDSDKALQDERNRRLERATGECVAAWEDVEAHGGGHVFYESPFREISLKLFSMWWDMNNLPNGVK